MLGHFKPGLIAIVLIAPLLVFARPPGGNQGHGNGHGLGKQGGAKPASSRDADENGNRNARADGGPGGRADEGKGQGMRDNAAGGRGGPDNDDGKRDQPAGGAGRGHSQGAAHASPRAFQAVCKNPVAASHSALGAGCGVVVTRDPKSGNRSYSQPGLSEPTPTPSEPRSDRNRDQPPSKRVTIPSRSEP